MIFNDAQATISCYVATDPTTSTTRTGVQTTRIRIAWTPRRLDRVTGEWTDEQTSFATVMMFRSLARNAGLCMRKGDAIVVQGQLAIRNWEGKDGVQRQEVEIMASHVGPDLTRGIARFERIRTEAGTGAGGSAAAGETAGSEQADLVPAGAHEGGNTDDLYDPSELEEVRAGGAGTAESGAGSEPELVAAPF